jgi:hypothetical protein
VLLGSVTMKKNCGLTEDEVKHGYVLTCRSVMPTSDAVVLTYDE